MEVLFECRLGTASEVLLLLLLLLLVLVVAVLVAPLLGSYHIIPLSQQTCVDDTHRDMDHNSCLVVYLSGGSTFGSLFRSCPES